LVCLLLVAVMVIGIIGAVLAPRIERLTWITRRAVFGKTIGKLVGMSGEELLDQYRNIFPSIMRSSFRIRSTMILCSIIATVSFIGLIFVINQWVA
jgi:hypothetical protein